MKPEKCQSLQVLSGSGRFLNDMKVIFHQKAEAKGLTLKFMDSDFQDCEFSLDSLRIEQILINLIGNSIKFTDEGFVTVSTRFKKNEFTQNYEISLIVADTGIGIQEDQMEKIFHFFEQSDNHDTRRFGGSGLGLGISKKLAEIMNGEILVDSLYGKGSVFTLKTI